MRIACISGWGQPHDALATIAPDATHVQYARHDSAHAALLDIAAQTKEHDAIIGWSLGGQLALRAIATGLMRPRKLVLISTPFQFTRQPELKLGMPEDTFLQFRDNYAQNPHATLNRAWALIAKDDDNAESVRHHLAQNDKEQVMRGHWLSWLDVLGHYSCQNLFLDNAPPTLILHGDRDAVVFHEQAAQIKNLLPHATQETITGCGHAPHWHDAARIKTRIEAHLHG